MKTRPLTSGMPIVSKYFELAMRVSLVGRRSGSSVTRPSISKRVVPGAPPASGTALVIATETTPGCDCSRSIIGRYSRRSDSMFGYFEKFP